MIKGFEMIYPKIKIIGIGSFAANCIKEIDSQDIPEVKTMRVNHISESDLYKVSEFLNEEPAITNIIADLGAQFRDSIALAVANLSKEAGAVTLCILTTPYVFEGEKALNKALVTASNIKHISDACMILGKDVPKDSDFCLSQMDRRIGTNISASTIANMVRDLVELTNSSGSINIDREDLEQTLRAKGTFVIARGEGIGERRVSEALDSALSSPLMRKCDVQSSRNIILKLLVSDQTELRTEELSVLSRFLERMPSYTDVKWGIAKSDALQADVELILLGTGYDVKLPEKSKS